jgi:hypothetical protein
MAGNGTKNAARPPALEAAAGTIVPRPSHQDWNRVAELFSPIKLRAEQLARFATTEGSDTEPWDVLLSMLAIDEHHALEMLGKRTGLEYVTEPRLQDSAQKYFESVPADISRQHQVAGVSVEHGVVTIASAQPMLPGV